MKLYAAVGCDAMIWRLCAMSMIGCDTFRVVVVVVVANWWCDNINNADIQMMMSSLMMS